MTFRAYKYRIYPTEEQQNYLLSNFGAVRFVWNALVEIFNSYSKCGPNRPLDLMYIKKQPGNEFLNDVISYAIHGRAGMFLEAKTRLFDKTKTYKMGSMKYKKKGIAKDSFYVPGTKIKVDLDNNLLKIPKMSAVKMKVDRKFAGIFKSVTISMNKTGQYFASILVEEEISPLVKTGRSIGVDLGLNHLLVTSDGHQIENKKLFRKNQAKLAKQQRHLSRKHKGSVRFEKQRKKVAVIQRKVADSRSWYLHNLSKWLVTEYDVICTEDLDMEAMRKRFGKSISDAGWGILIGFLNYKCAWYGKTHVKIDRFEPSTKKCSACGVLRESIPLTIRTWTCDACKKEHDRDFNAAINILHSGLNKLFGVKSEELPDHMRGEVVRPEVAIPNILASSVKRISASAE